MKAVKHRQAIIFSETIRRSFVKTLTFRLLVILSDLVIVYILTHRISLAVGFILLTNLAATTIHYLHERLWNRIHWGKLPKRIRVRL